MAKKKFDPKAKAKRQKVIVAVGGVLLLGLLAFQVPRTMKLMKSPSDTSSSSAPTTTSSIPGANPLAPPTLSGGSTSSGAAAGSPAATPETSADGVSDPSNPLPPSAGQLVSFSKFESKDPFKQQVESTCDTDPTGGPAAACTATSATTTETATSGSKQSASTDEGGTTLSGSTSSSPAVTPTKATIMVNGAESTVDVGSAFPSAAPVFTLVSLTKKVAKVGVAGGNYENGSTTIALKKGKSVTLMNTADGTRYVLKFVGIVAG